MSLFNNIGTGSSGLFGNSGNLNINTGITQGLGIGNTTVSPLGTSSLGSQTNINNSNINQIPSLNTLPVQQRQELERFEKRKISLQDGTSLMNPNMIALTYQLDSKAAEKQQEVDNYIYYNMNDEQIIKELNITKERNPDPNKCYTLPLKGFGELVMREQQQRNELEDLLNDMKAVKEENLKLLEMLNNKTLIRIEECKKRHQHIIHQLVHISCMLEEYGEKHNLAQINHHLDNQLNQTLHRIQENQMRLGVWQSIMNQINTDIKCIEDTLQDDNQASNNSLYGSIDLETILETLDNQQSLLENLDKVLRQDVHAITQLTSKA
ncbi:hypothetical protein ACR3K2_11680 [Cryptosporidium serpentis]